jgi:hypothetical protein
MHLGLWCSSGAKLRIATQEVVVSIPAGGSLEANAGTVYI